AHRGQRDRDVALRSPTHAPSLRWHRSGARSLRLDRSRGRRRPHPGRSGDRSLSRPPEGSAMTRPFGSAPAWALLLIASLLVAPTAAQPPPPAVAGTDVAPPPGAALPLDVTLRDLHGGTLATRALLRGRPVVLVFAYSDCPMLCSLVLRGLARAVRDAEARPEVDYALVTVSIDPDEPPAIARRTQSRLLALAGQSDHPGSWQYLLGEERAIGRLTAALGFRYRY